MIVMLRDKENEIQYTHRLLETRMDSGLLKVGGFKFIQLGHHFGTNHPEFGQDFIDATGIVIGVVSLAICEVCFSQAWLPIQNIINTPEPKGLSIREVSDVLLGCPRNAISSGKDVRTNSRDKICGTSRAASQTFNDIRTHPYWKIEIEFSVKPMLDLHNLATPFIAGAV
jgi:hypothetical protein